MIKIPCTECLVRPTCVNNIIKVHKRDKSLFVNRIINSCNIYEGWFKTQEDDITPSILMKETKKIFKGKFTLAYMGFGTPRK